MKHYVLSTFFVNNFHFLTSFNPYLVAPLKLLNLVNSIVINVKNEPIFMVFVI